MATTAHELSVFAALSSFVIMSRSRQVDAPNHIKGLSFFADQVCGCQEQNVQN